MIFSHFTLSQQVLSESCTFCAITGKRKFAFSTVASFSRQKPLKSKNKNDTIVWNKKFYYCAKFELYRIKDANVFPSMQLRALSWPGVVCFDAVRMGMVKLCHAGRYRSPEYIIFRFF